tara:strand:+ start:3764 stop:4831 length:1068 start_codon:yes stop_codon:yes gene_type:complete
MMDGRSFVAAQDFLLGAKMYWTTRLYPELREEFDQRQNKSSEPAQTAEDIAELMTGSVLYQNFAWLERHLQRFKYSGRYGLQAWHDQQRDELTAALDTPVTDGMLSLDDDLKLPAYYTSVDIHQHPGGVYGDEIAGFVYERGARSTTPMLGGSHKDLHYRFADILLKQTGKARRVVDLGCGFGKSTRPIYEGFRDAEVIGVDLSEPCLKLAATEAVKAQARNISFRQASAETTGLDDGSCDVVTSTMLLHEMPPPAIRNLLSESFRLLEPGGRMSHLDFYLLPDPFLRFTHYAHSRRNNEPYMVPLAELDIEKELSDVGFTNISIQPFEEAAGALAIGKKTWRFPWTIISAEKPL